MQRHLREVALKEVAQDGPKSWLQLKAELVSFGLDPFVLEEKHIEITDMFLEFLARHAQGSSLYDDEASSRRSSSLPRQPSPISTLDLFTGPPRPVRRTTTSDLDEWTPDHPRRPEEGWFWLREKTRERANVNFSFSPKPGNIIGKHIIDHYGKQLRPRIKIDMIELVCCLDCQPGRTYVINCQIKDSETFDIQLGKYWKGEPKEVQSDNGNSVRPNRDGRKSDSSSAQVMQAAHRDTKMPKLPPRSNQVLPPYPPEYLAEFFKAMAMNTPSTSQSSTLPTRARRRQDKNAGLETDPESLIPQSSSPVRQKARVSPSDFPAEGSSLSNEYGFLVRSKVLPRSRGIAVERGSDDSVTQASTVDTADDYQSDEFEDTGLSSLDSDDPDDQEPSGAPLFDSDDD